MKELFNKYKNYIYSILVLVAVSIAFVPQPFKGEIIPQSDIIQVKGMAAEMKKYRESTGEHILWTNSQFSGMPTYLIGNPNNKIPLKKLLQPKKPLIWNTIFINFICCFVMLIAFGVRPWLAAIGAIGMGLATENLTLLHVGHTSKAISTALLPLVIAGCQFIFRKKYLVGFVVLSFGMGLNIIVNHLQITYYAGIIIGMYFLIQLIFHIKNKDYMTYAKALGIAVAAVAIGVGANALPLMLTSEYSESTIRSASELSIKKDRGRIVEKNQGSGLAKDYAFSYSAGWTDIGATIIPNYSGGDSDKLGLYYGDIGSTSGPKYVGVIIFFLMILGFVLTTGAIRWWSIIALAVIWIISMGINNFSSINELLFESLPLFNKFRAPSMILGLSQLVIGILAFVGLERLFNLPKNDPEVLKKIKWTGFGFLTFLLILTFGSSMFNDFKTNPTEIDPITGMVIADRDINGIRASLQNAKQDASDRSVFAIQERQAEAREDAMKKDGYRSLFLVLLVFGVIWFYFKGKLDLKVAIGVLALLVIIDMWGVGKRYLPSDDFKPARVVDNTFPMNGADKAILQDQSHYRVLDIGYKRNGRGRIDPLNSSETALYHKSIGGYHAAKLRRYQELWDWHLMTDINQGKVMGNPLLDMLNMKYLMYPARNPQDGTQYAINPSPNGNAWFVSNIIEAKNADSSIAYLSGLNTKTSAVVESKYMDKVETVSVDSNSTIQLLSYHPEKLVYESNSSSGGFAVFSEIYYKDGWKASINGEPADHVAVNYVLRGLQVPEGKNTIEFEFKPDTYQTGNILSQTFSIIIILMLIGSIGMWLKRELDAPKE